MEGWGEGRLSLCIVYGATRYAAGVVITTRSLWAWLYRVGSAICLRASYELSGTDVAYEIALSGAGIAVSECCQAIGGTDAAYGATAGARIVNAEEGRMTRGQVATPIRLRACSAMSGTHIAYGVCLPTPCAVLRERIRLRACYAMSGTGIAYGVSAYAGAGRRAILR
eukprot:3941738-Rhodomonas_salina.1